MVIEIDKETMKAVQESFKALEKTVKIYLFTTTKERCLYCNEANELFNIIASLSDKIRVIKIVDDENKAKEFNVDKYPAIIIHGADKYNVRYFGLPVGYEFGVIVEDIVHASLGRVDIPGNVMEKIGRIDKPVHIQVFVTPTCPYCPYAALNAHSLAIVNKNIVADVIEAMEFPDLADKYGVFAVPKTIINNKVEFEGATSISFLVDKIYEALKEPI
ncbi:MAG: glutaredoxin [Thermofilum sp. ex4484_79]|nr:MAG: glutaredoxin [Thermofilum sp. ex4484_79]